MPVGKHTIGSSKATNEWSNKDLLIYFSQRLQQSVGYGLKLESDVEWAAFLGRIKGFRNKLHLNSLQYKDFIDKVFDNFFVRNEYIPVFGSIVSERVYNIIKKYCSSTRPIYSDFDEVKKELYSNNLLFKKLLERDVHVR